MSTDLALSDVIRATTSRRDGREALRRSRAGLDHVPPLLAAARTWRRRDAHAADRLARASLLLARRGREAALAAEASHVLGQARLALGHARSALRLQRSAAGAASGRLRVSVALETASSLALLGDDRAAEDAVGQARRFARGKGLAALRAIVDVTEATLLARRERDRDALVALDRARAALARRGEHRAVAALDVNRANALANLHQFALADRLYGRSLRHFRRRGEQATATQVEYNRAYLQFQRGRFHRALDELGRVREQFAALSDARHVGLCDLDAAEILLRLRQPEAAARAADRARRAFEPLAVRQDLARAEYFLAVARRSDVGLDQTIDALKACTTTFSAAGCSSWEAVASHRLAELEAERGDYAAADAHATQAALRLAALGHVERRVRAEVLRARIARRTGDADAARDRVELVLEGLRGWFLPWARFDAHHEAAKASESLGRRREALRHALRACALLERHRVTVPPDEFMASFLRDKAEIHEIAVRLALALRGRNSNRLAFRLAQQAKGRALGDLVAARRRGHGRARPSDAEVARIVEEIDALVGRLPSADDDLRSGASERRSDAAAADADRRLRACLLAQTPTPRDRVGGTPGLPSPESVARGLAPDCALVEYFLDGDSVQSFTLTRDKMTVHRTAVGRRQLSALLDRMRLHLDRPPERVNAGDARVGAYRLAAANAVLADLYAALVAPIHGLLVGSRRLVFVPHGPLHAVPFHALGPPDRPLLFDHEVVTAPTTGLHLGAVATKRRVAGSRVLVVSVADAAAPSIAEEGRRVAAVHKGSSSLRGDAATVAAFVRGARSARWVHVASHAVFNPDDPMRSGLVLADGVFTAEAALRAGIAPELLILSGCGTARTVVTEGDDHFGLTRGFIAAGVCEFVISLWPVSDHSGHYLMTGLHAALARGSSPAGALREAALAARELFPHPHHWAAFSVVGSGGVTSTEQRS